MQPSTFFVAQNARLRAAAMRGPVADLACGRGRHCLASAEAGARTIGVDRNPEHLVTLVGEARSRGLAVDAVRADLENDREIPFRASACAAILVFRFLYRPLAPRIVEALQPGGLLLYETFTTRQRDLPTGPSNPAFLLAPGELRELFSGLEVLEYWEGLTDGDTPAALARLAARKPG